MYILILIHLCHEASQQGYHRKIQPEWVMFLVPRISKLATVVPPGALWLRCPDFQGTQWSARATDFFSELIMGIMRSTVMGQSWSVCTHTWALGYWIIWIPWGSSIAIPSSPHPQNRTSWKIRKKNDPQEGSIPKRSPESQKCWPNIPWLIITEG